MKKLVLAVLLAAVSATAACRPGNTGQLTGAASPRDAVEQFLGAIRAQDLQAMSAVWGTSKGPARDAMPREELEKRELLMQCYLSHDRFRILSESPGEGGRRVFGVLLTLGTLTRETTFTSVQGPSQRWYLENADLTKTGDLCAQRSQTR